MRTAVIVILALLALTGCANNPRPVSYDTVPSAPPPPPPKPEWAVQFLKATDLLGKTKEAVVDQLGEPTMTNAFLGRADTYRYSIGGAPVEGGLFGGGENTVEYLEVKFDSSMAVELVHRVFKRDDRCSAGEAWTALDVKGDEPTTFLSSEDQIKRFLLNENQFKVSTNSSAYSPGARVIELPLIFQGKLRNGATVLLSANASTLPMNGERKFNTQTDSAEIGHLSPNPDFQWKGCSVYAVTAVKHWTVGSTNREFPLGHH